MHSTLVRAFAVGAIKSVPPQWHMHNRVAPQHKISIGESMNTMRTALRAMD